MTSASLFSAINVCIFLVASATARHIHRPQLHQHQRRQAVTITATETSSLTAEVATASLTAGNDAIEDIQQIQHGLSNLPADLLSFVQSVEARLGDVESMLSALIGSTSVPLAESTAFATQSQPSSFISSTTKATTTSIPLPVFYTLENSSLPEPTISSSPSSSTSAAFYTTTITSRITSTRVHTVTIPAATSTSSVSRGLSSGTFAGSGNWTLPLSTSGRPAIAPGGSAIRTVILAPAPTAWEQR